MKTAGQHILLISLLLTSNPILVAAQRITVNEPFPRTAFHTRSDSVINIAPSGNDILVINFWMLSCKPCVAEFPLLNKLLEQFFGQSQVRFISMTWDQQEEINKFLETHPLKYRIIPNINFMREFSVGLIPCNVIVNSKNLVLYKSVGALEPKDIEEMATIIRKSVSQ